MNEDSDFSHTWSDTDSIASEMQGPPPLLRNPGHDNFNNISITDKLLESRHTVIDRSSMMSIRYKPHCNCNCMDKDKTDFYYCIKPHGEPMTINDILKTLDKEKFTTHCAHKTIDRIRKISSAEVEVHLLISHTKRLRSPSLDLDPGYFHSTPLLPIGTW